MELPFNNFLSEVSAETFRKQRETKKHNREIETKKRKEKKRHNDKIKNV